MSYTDFQSQTSSEKVTIALVNGSRRLIYVDGPISVDIKKIIKITVDGETIVNSYDFPDAEFNYYDYNNVYKELTITPRPGIDLRNSFITLTEQFFFSTKGVALPNDLDEGYDVYFEPHIKDTSSFENSLDVDSQQTDIIEGDGSITFINDYDFWKKNYDKISFDNQLIEIYSWSPSIPIQNAQIIYRGNVYSRSYSQNEVRLNIKNILYGLRGSLNQPTIKQLQSKTDPALDDAKQRTVYGRLEGHRPVNLDKAVNNRYQLEGTITLNNGSNVVIGDGTRFKDRLLPNDKIFVANQEFTVLQVNSDTDLLLTSPNNGRSDSFLNYYIQSPSNKRYINRKWLLAGHPLHQGSYITQEGCSSNKLILNSTKDLYPGDVLRVINNDTLSIEYVEVRKVINSSIVTLARSLSYSPPSGLEIKRLSVSDVRMGDLQLVHGDDYTIDPDSAIIYISPEAEKNRSTLYQSLDKVTVNNGENFLTGVGTKFTSYIKVGDLVRPKGNDEFYTVSKVEDLKITLLDNYLGPSITAEETQPEIHSFGGLDTYKEVVVLTAPSQLNPYYYGGSWFWFSDEDGTVAVWYSFNDMFEEPEHGCDRSIKVSAVFRVASGEEFLNRTAQAINLDGKCSASINGNSLYIKNKQIGPRMIMKDNDGFTVKMFSNTQMDVTCIPDFGNSLRGKAVILRDVYPAGPALKQPVKQYFWFRVAGGGSPPTGEVWDKYWAVDIATDATASDVKTALIAQINLRLSGSAVSKNTDTLSITMSSGIASYSRGGLGYVLDSEKDFQDIYGYVTMFRQQPGRGTFFLHGKWFKLPYFDSTSKTIGYYFDIDNAGVTVPVTGATSDLEINTINYNMNEKEFFDKLGDAIEASLSGNEFVSTASDSSLLVTTKDELTISTVFNKGDSGLNITRTQPGIGSGGVSGSYLQYKNYVFSDSDVLTCTVYGKTDTGFSNGNLLSKAPEIVKDLLISSGAGDYIDSDSFDYANENINDKIAFAIPEKFNDKSNVNYRDVINKVNKSVMGMLLQTNDYKFKYSQIGPSSVVSKRFDQTDILSFKTNSSNKNLVKEVVADYNAKEYDYNSKLDTSKQAYKLSDKSTYMLELNKSITLETYLVDEQDAQRLANRWSFILEHGQNSFTFRTKLQGMLLQNNDVIKLSHPKLQERIGSGSGDKLMMIESIGKKGNEVEITCIDLSAAFNRCAKISSFTNDYDSSSDEQKLIGGFYKDQWGLIGDDPETFYTNLIW